MPSGIGWSTWLLLAAPLLFVLVLYGALVVEDRRFARQRERRRGTLDFTRARRP